MEREEKQKDPKLHNVPWQLVKLKHCHKTQQVHGDLMLPSETPRRYQGELVNMPVRLILLADTENTVHALTIMRDSTGINILHARLVTKVPSGLHAWVEPFRGNLEFYLRSSKLGLLAHREPQSKLVLPSPSFRSVVRGVVNGMQQLIVAGLYHGNFSFANTYYTMDMEDCTTLVVKLCNFKEKKEGTYKRKLVGDWKDILSQLIRMRQFAKELKLTYPLLEWCQLDGLINSMRRITLNTAEGAFEEIRRQPFFWGEEECKLFFIHDIPLALKQKQFLSKLKRENVINLPWNSSYFLEALAVMNKYRSDKGRQEYDTMCPVEFVMFVSGLYTHEVVLESGEKVYELLEDYCPGLHYKLYVLLPGAQT